MFEDVSLYVFAVASGSRSLQAARNRRRSPFWPVYAKDQRCSWRGYNLFGAFVSAMLGTQAWHTIWLPDNSKEGKPKQVQACSFWVIERIEAEEVHIKTSACTMSDISAQHRSASGPFFTAWIPVHCSSATQGGFVLFLQPAKTMRLT